jgi:DUF4097 and DUF4098 domain-containing protein YvlB
MKFREVLLLVLLIGAGLVLYQVQTGHWNLHFNWDEDFFGFGNEYTYEESAVFEAPFPDSLEIVNSHGWVVVEGTDEDVARLTFKKRVWRKNEEEARALAGELRYIVERTSDRLALSTNREDMRRRSFETGFVLTVPRGTSVSVKNSYGYVTVSDVGEAAVDNRHGKVFVARVEGSCKIGTTYDDVEVENVGAECRVTARHADVKALSIGGDVTIETSYAKIRVEGLAQSLNIQAPHTVVRGRDIGGTVDIETSYEDITLSEVGPTKIRSRHATVDADDVRGDLDVGTTYERVRATNIQGSLSVVGNNVGVSARGVDGPRLVIDTSYESVDVFDFSAESSIQVRNGNITLAPRTLAFPLDVRAENARIQFIWPAGEEAPVEARSKGGNVKWALSGEPTVRKTNGVSLIKAFEDRTDRPLIFLSTTYADIRIEGQSRDF